jgi:hypothetical protein
LASVGNRGSSSRTGYETKARTWYKHNTACKNRAQDKLSKITGSHSGKKRVRPSGMWHSVVWSIITRALMEPLASVFICLAWRWRQQVHSNDGNDLADSTGSCPGRW